MSSLSTLPVDAAPQPCLASQQASPPIPVSPPVSSGIFSFTLSWNEYLYALAFTSDTLNKTVPVGDATELVRGDVYHWGPPMAGALLGSAPVALVYSVFVEYYVTGLTGALKE